MKFRTVLIICAEYLAPEVVAHAGHDHSVDLWAVGILIYEMFCISTPFASSVKNNVKEIFTKITRLKVNFAPENTIPVNL